MNDPRPVPPPPPVATKGSLALGVACAWIILFAGYFVSVILAQGIGNDPSGFAFVLLAALPWLAMIGAIIFFAARGQSRTAAGVAIGIGSIIAVGLLLVAACFGLFATSNFH